MARELKEVVSHDDELIKELVGLWEQSVKASHSGRCQHSFQKYYKKNFPKTFDL